MRLPEAVQRRILVITRAIDDHEKKSKAINVLLGAYGITENFLAIMNNFSEVKLLFTMPIFFESLVYEATVNSNFYAMSLLIRNVEFSSDEERIKYSTQRYQDVIERAVTQRNRGSFAFLTDLGEVFSADRKNYPNEYKNKDFLLRKCQLCQLFIGQQSKDRLEYLCEWLIRDTQYIVIIEQDGFLKDYIKEQVENYGSFLAPQYTRTLNYIKQIVDPPLLADSLGRIQ